MIGTENSDGFLAAKAKLKERIQKGQPALTQKINRLKLKDIHELPVVFQQRDITHAMSESHAVELGRAIQRGQTLTPITVYWIGDAWCVIDGHHRLAAYRGVKYTKLIPVRVFEGTLEDARLQGLASNSKDKLPMSPREKYNAAWKMVISSRFSKSAIASAASVSDGLVGKMRAAERTIKENIPEQPLDGLTWEQARKMAAGELIEDFGADDYVDKEGKILADRFARDYGDYLSRHPLVTMRALELYDHKLLPAIVDFYNPLEEEDFPFHIDEIDTNPEF